MGAADLAQLVNDPFELLLELERRSRAAVAGHAVDGAAAEWVGIGFRLGEERFVAAREEVREVLMLPETTTRVPGAKRWVLGIANLRGHLLPLVDLKMFLGSGRTSLKRQARVIAVNHREIPAGLVVDEVLGFRRFLPQEYSDRWPPTVVRCDRYLAGAYQRGHESWPVFDLFGLVESAPFLQAAAD
ncbi:MAG TPA: chemotaxis protein CheW [Woeseiaceae bacterium]|nr:chemotaxis protein CheW [Woeseiaceae bacterium]